MQYLPAGRWFPATLLVSLLACCWPPFAMATPNQRPKPIIIFEDSKRLITQDSWDSVALYRIGDATVIRRFVVANWVSEIALTSDEKSLLIVCSNGSLSLWDVECGKRTWHLAAWQTGLNSAYDVSFAHNGQSFIVANSRDQSFIFQTDTGKRIGAVGFPPGLTNIMSAALSPDGSHGVVVDLGERIHTFNTANWILVDTKLKGSWPLRYSVDGKYIACRSNNSGKNEQLTVLAMGQKIERRDLGKFGYITNISPAKDGTFLVSADIGEGRFDKDSHMIGMQVWPDSGHLVEKWKLPFKERQFFETECYVFAPQGDIAVANDYRLVTTVVDLDSGKAILVIDNSANKQPGLNWSGLSIIVAGVVAMAMLALYIRSRWPQSSPRIDALALMTAVGGPVAVLVCYLMFVAGQSPVNDWACLVVGVAVGMIGFLNIRYLALGWRVGLGLIYGIVMFIVLLFFAVSVNPFFTGAFVLV